MCDSYHHPATIALSTLYLHDALPISGAAFTINTRPATWTTSANSKTYGDSDPNPLTTGSGTFLAADGVSATYTRAAGETVLRSEERRAGKVATAAVPSNYAITNAGAAFTINTRPATQ